MGCRGCGAEAPMTKVHVENLITKLINDGTIQAGLNSCDGTPLPKGAKLLLCDQLAKAVEALINDGTIDVVTDVSIKDGKLEVTNGKGETKTVTVPGLSDVSIKDGKLVVTKLDGEKQEVTLPGVKSVEKNVDKLEITYFDGEKTSVGLGVTSLSFLKNTLSFKEDGTDKTIELPYVQAIVGENNVIFTLPNGTTADVPLTKSILGANNLDYTIAKNANEPGKFGVVMNPVGGLKADLSGMSVKVGDGVALDDSGAVSIDPDYTTQRDNKAVEEGDRGRDEGKDYTDEKLRELKQNGAKVYVNGPITGDGTTLNRLGLNITDDFEILANGALKLKVKSPVAFTTFDSNYKLGFHTFTGSSKYNGSTFVKGVPLDINAEVLEQERALTADQQVDNGYDFNGYYIASANQLDVWLSGVDGTVWKITNDSGVNDDGTVKDNSAWGKWQKLDNNNSVTNEMVTRLQNQMNANNQKDQAQDLEIEDLKRKNTAQDLKDQEQDRRLDALEALNNTLCTIDVKQVSSYTLVDTDNTVISSGGVITVPDNITVGRVFTVIQKGTAEVRIAGTGVIAPYGGTLTLAGQNSAVTVLKTSANEVRVFGQTKPE